MPKNLLELLPELKSDIVVNDLTLDSRQVKSGDLFIAILGTHQDGREFITDAIRNGAVAILAEGNACPLERAGVPIFYIEHLNQKVGEIAAQFYNHPTQQMHVLGITGTNGKTSTSHFIASALTIANLPCGVIGTLGNGIYGNIQESNLTTPDAITLQKYFADFLKRKIRYVAMEVSSHSLDQSRVNGVDFELGVFTNLTRDHLDYHGTIENYANAKKKLFNELPIHKAIFNADDPFGRQLIHELHFKKPTFAYGIENHALPKEVGFVQANKIRLDLSGIHLHIDSPWGKAGFSVNLLGKFNVSNLLAAFTSLCALGLPFEQVISSLSQLQSVPGRMQTLGGKDKPLAVVDYAHTPDALEKVLQALRVHCKGKLFCIFGCGGDRDKGKRPLMAAIAEKFADRVMVTDDNPRTENPEEIFEDIFNGFREPKKIQREHDRALAIQQVIKQASSEDCVLVAGKGAENYQIIGKEKFPLSDVKIVSELFSY